MRGGCLRMDHREVEQDLVAERYLRGQLSDEQAARFEEHYLNCAQCLQRLELFERFDQAMKGIASELKQQPAASAGRSWVDWIWGRRWEAALASLLLMISAISLWAAFSIDRQLKETRSKLDQQIRLREEQNREREDLRAQLREARGRLGEERQGGLEGLQPQVNTLILRLSPQRSGHTAGEPALRLTLDDSWRWIVLRLQLSREEHSRYRLTLRDDDGQVVWQSSQARSDAGGELAISLHSSLLRPGVYNLVAEALPEDGEPIFAASFPFQVNRP